MKNLKIIKTKASRVTQLKKEAKHSKQEWLFFIHADTKLNIDFILNGAEEISLPNNSIDTVLVTYTLCTIPEVGEALNEMKRVLKDDGMFLFCEHGIAPDKNIVNWQNRINPLWGKLFGGCNINRDIPKMIQQSGLKINKLEQMYLPSTPKIVGYNYWGMATL